MKYWRLICAAIFFIFAAGLWIWGTFKGPDLPKETPTNKPRIATSVYPLSFLAQEVAGEDYEVVSVTPGGVEPHDFEPSPQDLVQLQQANVFIYMGGGLDPWADRVKPELEKKGMVVLSVIESLSQSDPHVWLDPVLYADAARYVRDVLQQAFAEDTQGIEARFRKLESTLSDIDRAYTAGLKTCVLREIIVSHNAFTYMGEAYDFTVTPIAGFSPQEQPSAKRLGELATLAKEKGITTIFFETLTSPKLSETLAAEVGATTAVLNPIEGISEDDQKQGVNYIALMDANLRALRLAMKCE